MTCRGDSHSRRSRADAGRTEHQGIQKMLTGGRWAAGASICPMSKCPEVGIPGDPALGTRWPVPLGQARSPGAGAVRAEAETLGGGALRWGVGGRIPFRTRSES